MVAGSRLGALAGRWMQEVITIEAPSGQGSTAGYTPRATDVPAFRQARFDRPLDAQTGNQSVSDYDFTVGAEVTVLVGDRITTSDGRWWLVVSSNALKPPRNLTLFRAEYRGTP